ncbi:hypothetical protein VCRA2113O325_110106 [Vibrio crassostreae]|nr:hypothetical protein VCRA2113O325_110106 [Vibrio crassostreae]
MIKFNITELLQVPAYLTNNLSSNSCLEVMDKEPINSWYIKTPKLIWNPRIYKVILAINIKMRSYIRLLIEGATL